MFASALIFVRVETAAGVHRGLGNGIGSRFDRQRTQQASDKSSQENDKETQPAVSGKNHLSLACSSHMKKTPHNPMMKKTLGVAIAAALTLSHASALVVPFIEDFDSGNSNWFNGASASATWLSSGGVEGGSFIQAPGEITQAGFGAIVFRGNNAADASADAFVGNWITGGVTSFSAYVWHDALVNLNFFARLDAGAGRAGSSVDFSVPSGEWFQLVVPIVDSPSSFQSFGAGTFSTVFTGIQNIQIVLSTTQDPSVVGQTYSIGLDRVAVVPEPKAWSLLAAGFLFMGANWGRRIFLKNK